jgi:hypothetical protein
MATVKTVAFFFGARPSARCRRSLTVLAANGTVDSPNHALPCRQGAPEKPWPTSGILTARQRSDYQHGR